MLAAKALMDSMMWELFLRFCANGLMYLPVQGIRKEMAVWPTKPF